MLHASGRVEAVLGSSSPDVKALAGIFLALYLLAATQVNLSLPLPLPLPLPLTLTLPLTCWKAARHWAIMPGKVHAYLVRARVRVIAGRVQASCPEGARVPRHPCSLL